MKYKLFDDKSILAEYLHSKQLFADWFIALSPRRRKLLSKEVKRLKRRCFRNMKYFKKLENK